MSKSNKIKVEITGSDDKSWYKNRIGEVFEVEDFTPYFWKHKNKYAIAKDDCKVIDETDENRKTR